MTHNINGEDTHLFDEAMEDVPRTFAGQVAADAYKCVLISGRGIVRYNEQEHQGLRVSTGIEFNIAPIDPTRRMINQALVRWSRAYQEKTRPSIEALTDRIGEIKNMVVGEFNSLYHLNGLFAIGEFVPKPENKEGQTFTTIVFRDVFATEAECKAAYAELTGEESDDTPIDDTTQAERASLAAFLPAMWEAANHDVEKMGENLAANPMLAQHFDITSREVKELIDADPSQEIPV